MFDQQIGDIFRRITSLLNRNVVHRVDNAHKNQLLYTLGLIDQEKEVEAVELYGMTAYPVEDIQAELVRFSVNGSEDHTLCFGATGGIYRPLDAVYGEVIYYSYLDKDDKHRIHLKQGREIDIYSTENVKTMMTPSAITNSVFGTATTTITALSINHVVTNTASVSILPSQVELDVLGLTNLKLTPQKIVASVGALSKVEIEPARIKTSVGTTFLEITSDSITLNVKGVNVLTMTEAGTDWLMKDYEARNV
jgi:phage gp45-like